MKPNAPALILAASAVILSVHLADLSLGQEQDRDPARAFEALKRRFDKDLNGKISEAEFGGRARAWKRLDLDGDGWLTLADIEARIAAGSAAGAKKGKPEVTSRAKGQDAQVGASAAATAGAGPATPEQIKFFETRVRPVLANECFSCHSTGGRAKGGLSLDSRAGFLDGGATGPALVPGDVEASAFIEAIRYGDPMFSMPPKTKLSDEAITDLEAWVRMGAPWPEEAEPEMVEMSGSGSTGSAADEVPSKSLNREIDLEAGRQFWSLRPVVRAEPVAVKEDDWSRNEVDRFLIHAMRAAGVEPVGDADDRTWLRRVTFDLTGLPPTLEAIAAYEADESPERDAHVVDRLLASDDYAERWGRHWLDVARYAESSGKERNIVYPHAWRYRDWVLEAFRQDMPYNEFLQLQIAGDLAPAADDDERAWNQIATGYLALGAKGHANRDKIRFQLDLVDEQIDAFSQGMLGMTLSCARCHDHKFDPVPTEDYYSLAGIMLSTETHFGTRASAANRQGSDLLELPSGASVPNGPTMSPLLLQFLDRGAERLADQVDEQMMKKEEGMLTADQISALQRRIRQDQLGLLEDLLSRFDDRGKALPSNRLAMGVSEGEPRDIAVLERGELDRPGEVVARGIPQVFRNGAGDGIVREGSGRAELGAWLASDDNPLTPRVWANRVWLHLFGKGLVPTPDNFGFAGQAPSHPELVDWLASELVAQGWSTKALIRELVLSRAYRLDSTGDRANEKIDPDVVWLWRMPERRMESEALRDAMLVIAGTLSPERPVGSPLGTFEGLLREDQSLAVLMREMPVRSVYLPSPRGQLVDTLEAFDAPDPEFVTGDRDETTVATQALFLMNDGEVLRLADAFADRLLARKGSDADRVTMAFELAYGRKPSREESRVVQAFLKDFARSVEKEARQKETPVSGADRKADDEKSRRARRLRERKRAREEELRKTYGGAPAAIEDPERAAWSAFAQSLFQSAEFRVIG
ncbi:Planctomycete cytochrome C [Planctomycetes bacterium Poly30]|uniref:Planctomycete cytochrome C n=1 Tax=Saltatorellus ferox TaxID=2528018 RepID=A0A518EL18_9BACT|nr:Planctomycete cytochrome C [Planctomycetes bacterium Poly30]